MFLSIDKCQDCNLKIIGISLTINLLYFVGFPYPRGPVCYNCENSPAGVPCHKIEFCETHEVRK